MTAPASAPGSPPSSGGASDPSMEDILASIRRILSEDEAETPPPPAESIRPGTSDVLTLDPSMLVEEPEAAPQQATRLPEPVFVPEPPPRLPPIAAPPAPSLSVQPAISQAPEPMPVPEPTRAHPEPLLGAEASAAASSSVGSLLRTLVAERQQVPVYKGGPTIEDLVREEVRPLLKEWLDSNLPPLVERLVRTEIERVVNRAVP